MYVYPFITLYMCSERNESLQRLNILFRRLMKWSQVLASCEAIGAVPGSDPRNEHSICMKKRMLKDLQKLQKYYENKFDSPLI